MAYKPNKWGYEGCNCKWKPSGSGTTHANRRAQRKHLQWEELEVKEPDTEEAVEDHVNALEKAAKKARERLEELKAKSLERTKKLRRSTPTTPTAPAPSPLARESSAKRAPSQAVLLPAHLWERMLARHLWKRMLARHLWKRMLARHLWKRMLARHLWKRC